MKRVLASLLFLTTAIQAATPAPQNSAASQPERLVSVAQSPYDFRFHIEHGEWDQVDATLRRIPTNYQFDAYKRNTPLMMVIDLFAHKVTDKPKSIWQTAVGGAVKACSGAALVVVGLAFALRAKNNWNAAKPAPRPARVRFGDAEHVDVDDVADGANEVDEKAAADQPRVRLQHPQYQDQTDAIRQKMDADKKADQHRAREELDALDAKKRAAKEAQEARQASYNPLNKITPLAERLQPLVDSAVDSLNGEIHKARYQDLKPALHTVEDAAMDIKNRAGAFAASAHEAVEDVRDAMHEGRQAVDGAKNGIKKLAKEARKTMRQVAHEAKQIRHSVNQRAEEVSNNVQEGVELLRDQGNRAWSFGAALGQGVGAVGCLLTGLWSGWKGFKNIKSLIGLPQRTQDLNKFRSLITDLLHREDVNLGIQNSDGETALQKIRRYMAENMNDRESYQLLSEVEQLIMIRQT